jgi:hypothetical protein
VKTTETKHGTTASLAVAVALERLADVMFQIHRGTTT